MTHPTGDPLIGRTVAHYEIVSRLGGGGMGVVYRANDRKLGRTVAVKFLPPQWSHDEAAKQRFIREAQAASATHHPAICTIHDIETADDGQLFIVMAYYEGPTLKERLQHGALPVDEALDIATQLADGLAKAHAQGVVHRDIKPGNLILTEDGVRIVDFGLATFADALQLTTDGSTLGTAAYMSPEQSRGEEADARTDVWAAGVVLYEMLAGHVPFRGSHAEAIAYAVRNDPAPALRAIRPEIPEEVEQLVFRALHKDASVRFQGGRELARALRQARGLTVPHDLRTQVVLPPPAATRGARRGRRAAGMALAILLTGTPAWLMVPVERLTVAVAPAVNRTGLTELNELAFALQEELAAAFRESSLVRSGRGDRIREVIRPFREKNEATSIDAVGAMRRHVGADFVLVPVVALRDGAWEGRAEIQRSADGAAVATVFAGGVPEGLLPADAAHQIALQLASATDVYFGREGPLRARVLGMLRRSIGGHSPSPRFASLAAAGAFERGRDAYERLEYSDALRWFDEAARLDPRSPMAEAWRSRTALVMGKQSVAVDAAGRVALLPVDALRDEERLFIEAVVAEARREFAVADKAYAALARDGEPVWTAEQAAYLDRRLQYDDAVLAWQHAIDRGDRSGRPFLELCRLYAPSRKNDAALALKAADEAVRRFESVGFAAGQAQVEMCRADSLVALRDRRAEAARHAGAALAGLRARADASYQMARALYYVGLTAVAEQRFEDGIRAHELARAAARDTGNEALVPFILQNLGAAYNGLGDRRAHVEVTRAGAALFAAQGEAVRAATMQSNAGATLIDFGTSVDEGFRLVSNALTVLKVAGRTSDEVFALQVLAAYHRYRGEVADAERPLAEALELAKQRRLTQFVWSIQMDQARMHYDRAEYAAAREAIAAGIPQLPAGRGRSQAEIFLAQIQTRLGQFDDARALLAAVGARVDPKDAITPLLLSAAAGELEYESGAPGGGRTSFRAAAASWVDDWPHPRSVEALAYAGWLERRPAEIRRVLDRAARIGRVALEARSRVFLARLAIDARRFDEALAFLETPVGDARRSIGPELRAQVYYWRGVALSGRGDEAGAEAAHREARTAIDGVRMRLPEALRGAFDGRADVRRIINRR